MSYKMIRIRCVSFLIIYGLLLSACKKKSESNELNLELISIDVSDWEKHKSIPDTLISEIRFVALETNDSCLVGEIRKILIVEDKCYVLDKGINKKVFVFDLQGNFLGSIGKYGKGPGEFTSITDFLIDEKREQLFALDGERRRVLVFDLRNGNFIRNFKIDFYSTEFEMLNDNSLVFFVKGPIPKSKKEYAIAKLNLLDKSYDFFLEKDDYYTPLNGPYSIFKSQNVLFCPFLKNLVYNITPDGLKTYIKFNFGVHEIPPEMVKNPEKSARKTIQLLESNRNFTYGIENIIENDDYITFSIKIMGSPAIVVYSKRSKRCLYGNRYDSGLSALRTLKNISVSGDHFISTMDAYYFKKYEKIFLENCDQNHKEEYMRTFSNISDKSNPVLIFLKYKAF